MATHEIAEIQKIFLSRLDTLDHILDVGEKHLPDFESAMQERLAPDMSQASTPTTANSMRSSASAWGLAGIANCRRGSTSASTCCRTSIST